MNKKVPKKIGEMNKVELIRELGRWMKRVEDQQKTIIKQREQIDTYMQATAQLNQIVEATLIAIVSKFGADVGNGKKEIIIPKPIVNATPTEAVNTTVNKDGTYTLTLEKIEAKKA